MTESGVQRASSPGALPVRLMPDPLIGIVGGAIFALGATSLGMMAAEPCSGDFMCPVMGLLFFGPPVLAYLAALVLWLTRRRIMPLLVLSVLAGLFGLSLLSFGYMPALVTPMVGFPFLAPLMVIGSIEVLRTRRIERWLSVAALGMLGVAELFIESPVGAIIAAVVAVAVAVLTRARPVPSSEPIG